MIRLLVTLYTSLLIFGIAPTLQAQVNVSKKSESKHIQWHTDYSQAVQEAQKNHLPLLLFFTGSDWCGWCKKMHSEVFASPEFAQEMGNALVFVDIDFPMNQQLSPEQTNQNAQLKQKYGVTGFPTIIILDYNQNFIAQTGYRPGGGKAFAEYLKNLLR